MRITLVFSILLLSTPLIADSFIKVDLPKIYTKPTEKELRLKVWTLEKAVAQLQIKVKEMEAVQRELGVKKYNCSVVSFGKKISSASASKDFAIEEVLKECAKKTNKIHCRRSEIKCIKE